MRCGSLRCGVRNPWVLSSGPFPFQVHREGRRCAARSPEGGPLGTFRNWRFGLGVGRTSVSGGASVCEGAPRDVRALGTELGSEMGDQRSNLAPPAPTFARKSRARGPEAVRGTDAHATPAPARPARCAKSRTALAPDFVSRSSTTPGPTSLGAPTSADPPVLSQLRRACDFSQAHLRSIRVRVVAVLVRRARARRGEADPRARSGSPCR